MYFVLVFVAALTFYALTLAPTLLWGDSAWLTLSAVLGITEVGRAADHPLYIVLGALFTALPGEPPRNLAWQSAVFGALGVALVFRIGLQLGASRMAAAVGAAALCVSHGFWLHAVMPEVYTANAFFLLATVTLALDWSQEGEWRYLAASGFAFTLGLANHLVLAGLAPALVVFIAASRPDVFLTRRSLVGAAAGLGVVALAFWVLPPLAAAAHRLWAGPTGISDHFRPTMPVGPMLREAGLYALYLVYQFPSVTLVLGVVGGLAVVRHSPRAAALLLGAVAINAGVFIHHTDWQSSTKFVFYISDYAVFAVLCTVGADAVIRRLSSAGRWGGARTVGGVLLGLAAVTPPLVYAAAPRVAAAFDLDLVRTRTLPYRDNQTYFLNPNKRGYEGARRFGEEALRTVPPSAVIFADFTPFSVLRYLQVVEGMRPDVTLRRPEADGRARVDWEMNGVSRRPTYVVALAPDYYDLTGLTGPFDLIPAGPLIEVRPRD
jgi:hypothetical protein